MASNPTSEQDLPPRPAAEWLALAKAQEREGELFRAYDLAMHGLAQHPGDLALRHRAVLCLASTGATRRAKAKYTELGLAALASEARSTAPRRLVMDVAALWARIVKDEALKSAGEARRARLVEAADLYEAVFRDETDAGNPEAYYPAINAATLRLLAGNAAAAKRLATAALQAIEAVPAASRGYWELASSVEALLILGELEQAKALAATARASRDWTSEMDFRALAGTLRQLRLVSDANGLHPGWLDALKLPRVAHYVGHLIAAPGRAGRFPAAAEDSVRREVEAAVGAATVGFAYGSLAAGADILFAEAFLARGASLHLVLPFNEDEFVEVSVRPAGESWVERYRSCRARAASIRFATEDKYLGDDRLFAYCSRLAMGLAVLRARHLSTEAEQFAVWDGQPAAGEAGTAADLAVWRRTSHSQTVIDCGDGSALPAGGFGTGELPGGRRTRAMLFGDVKGFSKLSDEELPRFTGIVLAAFARVIDRYGADVLLANTWGDGIFLVFDDAGKAAACALELQEAMASIDLLTAGLPPHLSLRLGGHLGPVYAEHDPIKKQLNFFGAHVSRAARIEPVTPEGCVYVTETLAAVLAIENAAEFACDYVGMTAMAKSYGQLRMFLLRRNAG